MKRGTVLGDFMLPVVATVRGLFDSARKVGERFFCEFIQSSLWLGARLTGSGVEVGHCLFPPHCQCRAEGSEDSVAASG